jgi:hypothetical protein
MDVESVKDRQPFALTLAAFDLAPFSLMASSRGE